MGGYENDANDIGRNKPGWVPSWCPHPDSLAYISSGLTAALLLLVAGYLLMHFAKGGNAGSGATVAAGVGVGGAGT